jgi:hypothetical protein
VRIASSSMIETQKSIDLTCDASARALTCRRCGCAYVPRSGGGITNITLATHDAINQEQHARNPQMYE